MSEYASKKHTGILSTLIAIVSNLFVKENSNCITINIPRDIVYRTELICSYISDQGEPDFDLSTFILLLYLDFIKTSITHYNPQKTFKKLTTLYYTSNKIVLSNGSEECIVDRSNTNMSTYTIEFNPEDIQKGELILNELYELFHYKISFSKMIEQIWIGFITEYKTGDNKKAFLDIKRMLKSCSL